LRCANYVLPLDALSTFTFAPHLILVSSEECATI
jgi:hypothetical protein